MTSPNDVAAQADARIDNSATPGVSSVAQAWSIVQDFSGAYITGLFDQFANITNVMQTIQD